jgi:TonB family protein
MRARVLAGALGAAATVAAVFAGPAGAEGPAAGAAQPDGEGMAVINCKVTEDRSLTDCKLLKEAPPGSGFGAAALKMAGMFRLSPQSTVDASGRVTLPILFKPGGADTAPDGSGVQDASPAQAPAAPDDGAAAPAADLPDLLQV